MTDKTEDSQMHPGFPVVDGVYKMNDRWQIKLPTQFNTRFEEGSLVIWRLGTTFWIDAYGNDKKDVAKRASECIY